MGAYPLLRLVLLVVSLSLLAACSEMGTLSEDDLGFSGIMAAPPPRSLGPEIRQYVDKYKEMREQSAACSTPAGRCSDEQMDEMARRDGDKAPWRFMARALDEYLYGNLTEAARFASRGGFTGSTRTGSLNDTADIEGTALAQKAIFLAEAGRLYEAETALAGAQSCFRTTQRWNRMPGYYRHQLVFWSARSAAAVAMAEGDFVDGEKMMRRALAALEKEKQADSSMYYRDTALRREGDAKIVLARALLWQGRLLEAEKWAREAVLVPYHLAWNSPNRTISHAMTVLGEILLEQGRLEDAETTARTALNSLTKTCQPLDSYHRARSREVLAKALMAQGRWGEAVEQFQTIERELKTDPQTFQNRFQGSRDWAWALYLSGKIEESKKRLGYALEDAEKKYGPDHYNAIEMKALRSVVDAADGRSGQALTDLEKHLPDLLGKWRQQDGESVTQSARGQRLAWLVEAYLELAGSTGEPDRIAKAFTIAGSARARKVARSLAAGAARVSVNDPELASMLAKRREFDTRLAGLRNRLLVLLQNSKPDDDVTRQRKKLEADTRELQAAINELDRTVADRFPRFSNVVNPGLIGVEEIRKYMRPEEAFVYIFTGRKQSFVWAFGREGGVSFKTAPLGEAELNGIVVNLRKALAPTGVKTVSDIPAFDTAAAYDLYRRLLEPVEPGWRAASEILAVIDGPLGQLPLSVLPERAPSDRSDGPDVFSGYRSMPWLVRTHAFTYLPSTASVVVLRTLPDGRKDRRPYAGFGDPRFDARTQPAPAAVASRGLPMRAMPQTRTVDSAQLAMLPPLPETAEEVRSIALAMGADPDRDVFTGQDASEERVKTMDLSDRRVLVFATHGLAPGDLDGLTQPALALSSPLVRADRANDGLLTMGEVMGLNLGADWVVLSACNTAAADGRGAEAVSGLGQSFFYAGARSLLVTSWPVETTSAMALTTELFQRQADNPGLSRTEALRLTMNHIMDGPGGAGFTYAHPLFWAPFILAGDGGI